MWCGRRAGVVDGPIQAANGVAACLRVRPATGFLQPSEGDRRQRREGPTEPLCEGRPGTRLIPRLPHEHRQMRDVLHAAAIEDVEQLRPYRLGERMIRLVRREVPVEHRRAVRASDPSQQVGELGAEVLPPLRKDDDEGRVSSADGCAELDEIAVDRTDAVVADQCEVEQQPVVLQDVVSIEGVLAGLILMNGEFVDRTAAAVVGTQQTDRSSAAARARHGLQKHDPALPQDRDGGVPALRLDEQTADPIFVLLVELTDSTSRPPLLDGTTHRPVVHMKGGVEIPTD